MLDIKEGKGDGREKGGNGQKGYGQKDHGQESSGQGRLLCVRGVRAGSDRGQSLRLCWCLRHHLLWPTHEAQEG